MKKNLLFFATIILLSMGCKEKPIIFDAPVTTTRKVLVEELTGVRCTQCPNGARVLEELQGKYGKENLIVVSIHAAGNFSVPYNESKYDFRNPTSEAIKQFIGSSLGYPTASVNRDIPEGTANIFSLQTKWAGVIANEYLQDNNLDLVLGNSYDSTSRRLTANLIISPLKTRTGDHYISVLLIEDKIKDYQLDNGVKIPDYTHRHVLRAALTAPTGDAISEQLKADALIPRTYTFTIPPEWNADNCSVVAFVHHGGTPNKEILQAIEKKVK